MLRALAGLNPAGRIVIDGEDMSTRPPAEQRPVAWVPQRGALFPHLERVGQRGVRHRAPPRPGSRPGVARNGSASPSSPTGAPVTAVRRSGAEGGARPGAGPPTAAAAARRAAVRAGRTARTDVRRTLRATWPTTTASPSSSPTTPSTLRRSPAGWWHWPTAGWSRRAPSSEVMRAPGRGGWPQLVGANASRGRCLGSRRAGGRWAAGRRRHARR